MEKAAVKVFIALLFLIQLGVISGCTSFCRVQRHQQFPAAESAVIQFGPGVRFLEIDGKPLVWCNSHPGYFIKEIGVSPGRHSFKIRYRRREYLLGDIRRPGEPGFLLVAGRRYRLRRAPGGPEVGFRFEIQSEEYLGQWAPVFPEAHSLEILEERKAAVSS